MPLVSARLAVLLGCALCLGAPLVSRAEEKPAEAPKTAALTAEQEEVVKTHLTRMRGACERLWRADLKKRLEEFKKYGLPDDRRQPLTETAEKAFAETIDPWALAYEKFVRETWLKPESDAALLAWLKRLPKLSDGAAEAQAFNDAPNPFERAAWRAAVRLALGDEGNAKWQEAEAEKDTVRAGLIVEAIQNQEDDAVEGWLREVELKIAELSSTVALKPEQTAALQELGQRLVEESKEPFRKSLRKTLNGQKISDLKNVLIGRVRYGVDEVKAPPSQPAWKDGVTKIIGEEAMKQIAAADAARRTRRIRSLGLLLIAQMDARIALTTGQRERLQPLAEALAKKEPTLLDRDPSTYFNVSSEVFISAAAKAKPEELKPILDAAQLRRWQQAGNPEALKQAQLDDDDFNGQAVLGKPRPRSTAAVPREEVEKEVCDFLIGKAEAKRRDMATLMEVKAEDLARVGKLPEDKSARLEFAARGAVERTLTTWSNTVETTVRSSVGFVDPRLVRQRLASMGSYAEDSDPEKNELWTRALKSVASEAQIAAWKKEIEAREQFELSAITQYLLAEFDLLARLTAEQWKALEPKLAESLRKNGPSIQRMFGYSARRRPWFLLSYSRMVPFHGIPEADMKATLSKPQWDRWSQSQEYSNSAMYWGNIEQMNQARAR